MRDAHPVDRQEATALSTLFVRYLDGQISDGSWSQMMSILDEDLPDFEARVALFSFLSDAFAVLNPSNVDVPRLSELDEFVGLANAT